MAGEGDAKNGTNPAGDGTPPAANVEMVPKADLLRAQGEKGPLAARIKELEAELAASKDREELRQKGAKSTPTDDERKAFDDGVLSHRAEQRKLQEERMAFAAERKAHEEEKRSFFITRLTAQYPSVKAEELQALGTTVSAEGLELFAAKTQLQRGAAASAKKSLSDKTLDTSGGAQGATDKKGLSSQEKIRLGTQQYIERTMGQREGIFVAPPPRKGA